MQGYNTRVELISSKATCFNIQQKIQEANATVKLIQHACLHLKQWKITAMEYKNLSQVYYCMHDRLKYVYFFTKCLHLIIALLVL